MNWLWQLLLLYELGLSLARCRRKWMDFTLGSRRGKWCRLTNSTYEIISWKYKKNTCHYAVHDGVWRRHDNVSFLFRNISFESLNRSLAAFRSLQCKKFVHFGVKLIATLILWYLWISLYLHACIYALRLLMHWSFFSAKGVWDLIQWRFQPKFVEF